MPDIEIEINGQSLTAKPGQMVIEVADAAGIYIPRFCYHKHLSVAANCRMCLVEVEKVPKALPACATPVAPGMKISTRSKSATDAQKAVMEFLLINHPLDCPICDQGGECELQDLSLGFGRADSYYNEGKRSVKDKDIGPLVATEMTRCIQCTRCVRFGEEIAGVRELGATGRGGQMQIGTYVEQAVTSELSGNIIDLCPVGALTSKPFRFKARAWELQQFPSIAPHDGLGANINLHVRNGKVMRVVPRENTDINQTWLSDRDRFSYEGLSSQDRLTKPLIRTADGWQETDWQTALSAAADRLRAAMSAEKMQADAASTPIVSLATPNATLEEFYLLQKLTRALGSSQIDYRLRESDFSDEAEFALFPGFDFPIAELETSDVILLVGSIIRHEQPLLAARIRAAVKRGAQVIVLAMQEDVLNFEAALKQIIAPQYFSSVLAGIAKGCDIDNALLANASITAQDQQIADLLKQASQTTKKITILLGVQASQHPEAAVIRSLTKQIALTCGARFGLLTDGANTAGAWLAGAIPHRGPAGQKLADGGSVPVMQFLQRPQQACLLLNVEPEDCAIDGGLQKVLANIPSVIALSVFSHPMLFETAQVILPITPFTETAGTLVNLTGTWQSFTGVVPPLGEARPAWKVLRVLGNLLGCDDFNYESAEQIRLELAERVAQCEFVPMPFRLRFVPKRRNSDMVALMRIGTIPLYATDALVRRAPALQKMQQKIIGSQAVVKLHPVTAASYAIQEGAVVTVQQEDECIQLPVVLDSRIPENAAWIPSGIPETVALGKLYGAVELVLN